MSRVVLRAQYKTDKIFNEGHICIDGPTIEGIFTLDYMKILFTPKKTMAVYLCDLSFLRKDSKMLGQIRLSSFESQKLYTPEIECPEEYLLYGEKENLTLTLLERETDFNVINHIFYNLEKLRH